MKNSLRSLVFVLIIIIVSILSFTSDVFSQKQVSKGTVQRIKVHGKGLEGNLEGDSADRYVSVYLPASYKTNPKSRYPVVYFLHGYTDDDAKWYGLKKHWINLPLILDTLFAEGSVREMIVVTPDAYTRYQGSMYSNSITTGNWEDYVAKELVAYIDSRYRTIANASSRGLSGHSMGGYGALRIGQKHPETFSSIYLLSPCCLMPGPSSASNPEAISKIEGIQSFTDFEKADFGTKIAFASAAAWSPNPTQAPFYLDLPVKNGQQQSMIQTKWAANMPLVTLDQYINNLKQLKGIAFDAGTRDQNIAASIKVLDAELTKYGIKHFFEIYEGNHTNRIAERIDQKMMQFFSSNLSFGQRKK